MVVRYNDDKDGVNVGTVLVREEGREPYVHIDLEDGQFLTLTGSLEDLEHLVWVLSVEKLSFDLNDFEKVICYENLTMDDLDKIASGELII